MYKEEIIKQYSPGTIRETYDALDKTQWKRVSFIDSYDQGYVFDIGKDNKALEQFLDANGGFRAVFDPHADWAPDTVRIDCERIVA